MAIIANEVIGEGVIFRQFQALIANEDYRANKKEDVIFKLHFQKAYNRLIGSFCIRWWRRKALVRNGEYGCGVVLEKRTTLFLLEPLRDWFGVLESSDKGTLYPSSCPTLSADVDSMLLCYGNEDSFILNHMVGLFRAMSVIKICKSKCKSWVLIVIGISLEGG